MDKDELKEIVEEVLERLEDEEIADNLDATTRYMPDEEAPTGW